LQSWSRRTFFLLPTGLRSFPTHLLLRKHKQEKASLAALCRRSRRFLAETGAACLLSCDGTRHLTDLREACETRDDEKNSTVLRKQKAIRIIRWPALEGGGSTLRVKHSDDAGQEGTATCSDFLLCTLPPSFAPHPLILSVSPNSQRCAPSVSALSALTPGCALSSLPPVHPLCTTHTPPTLAHHTPPGPGPGRHPLSPAQTCSGLPSLSRPQRHYIYGFTPSISFCGSLPVSNCPLSNPNFCKRHPQEITLRRGST
jgi:hypothetical protein